IEEFTTWLANTTEAIPAGKRKVVQFTIASNQRNDQAPPFPVAADNLDAQLIGGNIVTYGLGNLIGVQPLIHGSPSFALPPEGIPQLTGVGHLWFSDRKDDRWGRFGNTADNIRLTLNWPGRATIVLESWGNASFSFDLQCTNDVMFGFGSSVGNQSRPALY